MKRTPICAVLALAATTVATVLFGAAGPAQAAAATTRDSGYAIQLAEQEFTGFGQATTKFGAINQARADANAQASDAGFSNCVELAAVAKFLASRQIWVASVTISCTQ